MEPFSSNPLPNNNKTIDFPPGVRFCPFDHELIYLHKLKIMDCILPYNQIQEVNLYKYSPAELSDMYPRTEGEKEELYVFTPRDRKYRNGTRPNRAAGNGYWKAAGADKPITHGDHGVIGYKKTLVYYEGRPPKGEKTNWIMHEFTVKEAKTPKPRRDNADPMRLDDWVLCRIYKKTDKVAGSTQKEDDDESNVEANEASPPPPPPQQDEEGEEVQEVQEVRFSVPLNEMTFYDTFEFGNDPVYNDAQFINSDSFIPEIIYNQPLDFHIDHIFDQSFS
ncbi:PREDICTED: NAC transcription factor 32-like [Ipomoea nil]|uniref:NAC transcription factor 32-like n=1 Tax=Ipomoea nil TaxID=35883 RepID=UPI0009013852|nr:PREDICTED: NAC transcription factor 32-like [Ipomoea nil]